MREPRQTHRRCALVQQVLCLLCRQRCLGGGHRLVLEGVDEEALREANTFAELVGGEPRAG